MNKKFMIFLILITAIVMSQINWNTAPLQSPERTDYLMILNKNMDSTSRATIGRLMRDNGIIDSLVWADSITAFLSRDLITFAGDIKVNGNDITYGNGASTTNPSSGVYSINSPVVSIPADSTRIDNVLSVDKIRANAIIANSLQTDSSVCVIKNGDSLLIRTQFDETRDLVQIVLVFKETITGDNAPIEFLRTYLIPNTNPYTLSQFLTSGIIIHYMGDNAAPYNYDPKTMNYSNPSYFDGNHGYDGMEIAIVTSHDKTTEDIGSTWTDGDSKDFVLVRIVDTTTLWFLSKDTQTLTGNLTHKSNATHTSGITVNSLGADPQYEPTVNNRVKKAYLSDDTEIVSDGVYYTKELRVKDTHYIANITASLDSIIAHVGESDNTVLNLGEPDAIVDISMIFDKYGNCTQNHFFKAYRALDITYMSAMQSTKLYKGTYDSIFVAIPNTLPISDGVKTWALDRFCDYTNNPAADLSINSTYWMDSDFPPSKINQFIGNSSVDLDVGFYQQYNSTYGESKAYGRKNNCTNAWILSTNGKSYPYFADSKIGDLVANQSFSISLSTGYYNPKAYSKQGQAYFFKSDDDYILNAFYNNVVAKDTISIPIDLDSKKISEIYKSTSLQIGNKSTCNNIYPTTTSNGNMTILLSNSISQISNKIKYYNEVEFIDTTYFNGRVRFKPFPTMPISSEIIGMGAGKTGTTGAGNTIYGYTAGQSIGSNFYNTFIGALSGYTSTGSNNTFLGYYSGYYNSTGTNNTFTGLYAGRLNGTASRSTYTGAEAGYGATGANNSGFGFGALRNTTGTNNAAFADSAGYKNTIGSNNIFLGYRSGGNNTTGNRNMFFGDYRGYTSADSMMYFDNTGKDSTATPLVTGNMSSGVNRGVTIDGILTLTPVPTAHRPTVPVNGTIYIDATTNTVKVYINGAWYNLDMTAE